MSEYTPGPWLVAAADGVGCWVYSEGGDPEGDDIARIEWLNGVGRANARLIAAAPELLETLREIAKGEGRYSRDPLEHAANTIDDMKALALAAIAKAEGR